LNAKNNQSYGVVHPMGWLPVCNIKTQIETLKELCKTLTNDAVTGKIKVTEQ